MRLVVHADQLRGDPELVSLLADAALEHRGDVQLAADLGDLLRRALVGHGRRARNNLEASNPRKPRDQLLGDPVGEVLVATIRAQAGEGQYRDAVAYRTARYGSPVP